MTINERLHDLYSAWKARIEPNDLFGSQLSAPSLVSVPDDYETADARVVFVGQEDKGNAWSQKILDNSAYRYGGRVWEFYEIDAWSDFLANEDAVDALMAGYRMFNFAEHQPKDRRSPFWRTFRDVARYGCACTTNLDRSSWKSGSIDKGPAELRTHLDSMGAPALLRAEIRVLNPTICLFVTGRNRDHLLRKTWPNLRFEKLSGDIPETEVCRIVSDGLPALSFRTDHPTRLERCGKDYYLDIIDRLIRETAH